LPRFIGDQAPSNPSGSGQNDGGPHEYPEKMAKSDAWCSKVDHSCHRASEAEESQARIRNKMYQGQAF
jgi:hypothetical protein